MDSTAPTYESLAIDACTLTFMQTQSLRLQNVQLLIDRVALAEALKKHEEALYCVDLPWDCEEARFRRLYTEKEVVALALKLTYTHIEENTALVLLNIRCQELETMSQM
jgi:hypothetical protein